MEKSVAPSIVSLLAGAAAAVSFASPAAAQSFSKTEAILGGPERARGVERSAERPALCRFCSSGDAACLAVLPADGFRSVSRSSHGQPRSRQRPPRRFRDRGASRRPHAARRALAQGRIFAGPRDRGALRRNASRQGQGRAARGGQLVRQQARPLRRRFGPVRPRPTSGPPQAIRSPAAAATARISPSPSCRCCAAPESPTATFIW